jgi:hypothetical protein
LGRGFIHQTNPRTAFGISQDRRFLYLITIDGRQPGYSDGAYDYETAGWLLLLGAYDGVNLDGGGSTTLVVEDSTGVPVRLNRSSAVADSGRERTVGSHFGVFAKPLRGFINDVSVLPEDTTAKIRWTTIEPATSEVQFGVTSDLGNSSGIQSSLQSDHEIQLSGLTPDTAYYYRILSSADSQPHISANYFFVTTNYVTTNQIFALTNSWRYTADIQDGTDWTNFSYDDSAWSGPGPALLWLDVRAAGPNPAVEPKNTELPADSASDGYPYVTYYFRTHFIVKNVVPGSVLKISGYVDDGAVFFLNGTEIQRVRMPDVSDGGTLASSAPCNGDATCLDEFTVPTYAPGHITVGDNVLAAEVHNYNLRSADITFGISLDLIEPVSRSVKLQVTPTGGGITLNWDGEGFVLQSADAPQGPWSDLPGPVQSPFVTVPHGVSQYFRLKK